MVACIAAQCNILVFAISDERLEMSETDPSRPPLAATLGEEREAMKLAKVF